MQHGCEVPGNTPDSWQVCCGMTLQLLRVQKASTAPQLTDKRAAAHRGGLTCQGPYLLELCLGGLSVCGPTQNEAWRTAYSRIITPIPPQMESVPSRTVRQPAALPGARRPFTYHMAIELITCCKQRLEKRLGDRAPVVELLTKNEA